MSYSNAVFYIDLESGSDTARTALTTVTVANPSGSITRCTKTAHGLVTGAVVTLSAFTAWLNAAWMITVVDADNFDLDTAVWQATADANGTVTPFGGSSKADAWRTFESGATAARIAPGDTIRVMATPNETLVGNATWTDLSKTVTLAGAVTANITDCETAWTASANVTATADTSLFKENTKSMKAVIAAGFTTGLVAYFATGTLDLSAYEQVSFYVLATGAIPASTLSLRLCSDAAGVTTVHTIAIPASPAANVWVAVTVNVGSALNSAIASVALYADLDPGSLTVQIDNIIACKAAASADSLTLTSLIGKVWNLSWVASTTYAANDIRRPTQPNRNGFCYKVTAGGGGAAGSSEPTWPALVGATVVDGALTWTCLALEDTYYPIQSINGTTVKLDNYTNNQGNAGRGYSGTTETVATYKREVLNQTMVSNDTTTTYCKAVDSGTQASRITFTGGWNRTDMTTQTGETWISGQNGWATAYGYYSVGRSWVTWTNLNAVRCYYGAAPYNSIGTTYNNCHFNGCAQGVQHFSGQSRVYVTGMVSNNNALYGYHLDNSFATAILNRVRLSNNMFDGVITANSSYSEAQITVVDGECRNNGQYGVNIRNSAAVKLANVVTGNNVTAGMFVPYTNLITLNNCLIPEGTEFTALVAFGNQYIYSQKHDQTADNHLITTDGGTIISATDQRHTASGISWKFRPTSTNRGISYPLRLSIGKVVCAANTAVNLTIWTRRDSTNINGTLRVAAGQLTGIADTTVACAPTIDTWVQSSTLTVTPTEAGVIEVTFECYDGVGTTNAFWIDDLEVA